MLQVPALNLAITRANLPSATKVTDERALLDAILCPRTDGILINKAAYMCKRAMHWMQHQIMTHYSQLCDSGVAVVWNTWERHTGKDKQHTKRRQFWALLARTGRNRSEEASAKHKLCTASVHWALAVTSAWSGSSTSTDVARSCSSLAMSCWSWILASQPACVLPQRNQEGILQLCPDDHPPCRYIAQGINWPTWSWILARTSVCPLPRWNQGSLLQLCPDDHPPCRCIVQGINWPSSPLDHFPLWWHQPWLSCHSPLRHNESRSPWHCWSGLQTGVHVEWWMRCTIQMQAKFRRSFYVCRPRQNRTKLPRFRTWKMRGRWRGWLRQQGDGEGTPGETDYH